MAEIDTFGRERLVAAPSSSALTYEADRRASRQAYELLHWGFVAAPTLAGLDKFLHLMTNWDQYLAPQIARVSPIGAHGLMSIVGGVEIAAGFLVAVKPRIGAYVVAAWLAGIIVNLFLLGAHYDIALRDFGLFLGALALGRLASTFDVSRRRVVRVPLDIR